jgi:glutamate 5-kinase
LARILLAHDDLSDRRRYLNAADAPPLSFDVIPIING